MGAERREQVRQFCNKWMGRGKEDEDDQSFWNDFLHYVLGVENATDRMICQKKVLNDKGNLANRIDVYIPETRVIIEQKSLGISLDKPQPQHNNKTPYEQAKDYDNNLPISEKAKWIILSNFGEIWVYDMDSRKPEPVKFALPELVNKYSQFEFLLDQKQQKIQSREMEVSVKAGEFVGLLYDALHKEYINPDSEESLKSLNMLCVRLVFCLYGEDAKIFGKNGHMFHDYLNSFETKDMRKALIELFKILDTPEDKRDPYDTSELSKFPYVNGGLFEKEDIEIPNFTDEIREVLLAKASEGFDWSQISPTIFGAVFESTLNPETRRKGGMHYTSIENIHKVIDPLFLDELKEEYDSIFFDKSSVPGYTQEEKKHLDELKESEIAARSEGNAVKVKEIEKKISSLKRARNKKSNLNVSQQVAALEKFQDKLASLTFLDPACGSGNFLTETYISLRRLENQVIRDLLDLRSGQTDGQIVIGEAINPIRVGIEQFYGIEINDFAVTVGKTALWIAESQMMKETEDIISANLNFLPLKTNANIHEGNSLRLDWNDIIPKTKLSYLMGNPPFIGTKLMNKMQKEDTATVLASIKKYGVLDYVACWYKVACDYIKNTNIKCALVSTNSIVQGEQVNVLWGYLNDNNCHIDFAYRTFIWDSEASIKAHVHCVIIGFSYGSSSFKYIYADGNKKKVDNINGYLIDAPNVFIDNRKTPICDVPLMYNGCKFLDDGNYVFTEPEKEDFIKKDKNAAQFFRPYLGAQNFISGEKLYCIWLKNATPSAVKSSPSVMERIAKVKDFRLSCNSPDTQKYAERPTLPTRLAYYTEDRNTDVLLIPIVSSERRRYVPIGYVDKCTIVSYSCMVIPDASLYTFGVMLSNVHNAWMRVVCGRLKSDFRYSNTMVYNNFPWPTPTEEQKKKIEETAQGIIDARALYPDSSLADLYDPLTMPVELQKAHAANDKAVMQTYGFDIKRTTEADCVAKLMQMYKAICNK